MHPGVMRHRQAGRTILVDRRGRVLLFRGRDPARPQAGTWWFTPGGAVEPGETVEAAAIRELREETGVVASDVGEAVLSRTVDFDFDGIRYRQAERFFLVTVDEASVDQSGWTNTERRVFLEHRWWSVDELHATRDVVYPEGLAALLSEHL